MKKIEIEDDLYKYILANIEAFGETPSQILRRLLALPPIIDSGLSKEKQPSNKIPEPIITIEKEKDSADKVSANISNDSSLPGYLANGVEDLFTEQTFKSEPIVTNKFKMMLTAMYHENRAGFIVAADTTKGRTRNYLGQNLSELLASENEEEVTLLKASKPHNIPHTPFWVITNANTGRKRIILTQMMASMGYPHRLIERINEEI